MTVSEQLGRNLRRARRRAYMSQEDLARRAGVHHTEIGLLERGALGSRAAQADWRS